VSSSPFEYNRACKEVERYERDHDPLRYYERASVIAILAEGYAFCRDTKTKEREPCKS
jgi:hypothetical protein